MKLRILFYRFVIVTIVAFASSTCFARPLATPNPEVLGSRITSANAIFRTASEATVIFPKEVRFVLEGEEIDEIQAFYNEDIQIDQIAAKINERYKDQELTNLRKDNFRLWRIPSEHFVIQLSVNGESKILILTRMTHSKKK